jgi:xanthine dehydrogenase accessory factor
VGIPIRAETPEEIAVSVLAEIIAVSRGADIVSLRASL